MQQTDEESRIVEQQRRIEQEQRRARKYLQPETSLTEELLKDRREEARSE